MARTRCIIALRKSLLFFAILLSSYYLIGQEYFQQQVNYKIDVSLVDNSHDLHAFETIEYINNSPDDLSIIYMHLWPNAYKNNSTALAKQKLERRWAKLFDIDKQVGYIDSLDFKIDGEAVNWEIDSTNIDICTITLNRPLKSGESMTITTPFHVQLPSGVSRLGHIGESYQITQWYPKPAVYDNNKWHPMPYLSHGEYYSEFGSFDVSITLPSNYVVGATGELQTTEEIEWLDALAEKTANLTSFDKSEMAFPPSSSDMKTIRFSQDSVHDFAWFADKRFHVSKDEITLPNSGRKVTTWAMFTNDGSDEWTQANQYINDALLYYSNWVGDYPYKSCTAVLASLSPHGAMEYPTITMINSKGNSRALEQAIVHEVGHNWFYGVLANNERDNAWLDEGIVTFYGTRYMESKYGSDNTLAALFSGSMPEWMEGSLMKAWWLDKMKEKKLMEFMYLPKASQNADDSPSLGSGSYSKDNYNAMVYAKPALVFNHLMEYLGEDEFDSVFQAYYDQWKLKHPHPKDLKEVFINSTGKDLDWAFEDLLKGTKKIDYGITKAEKDSIKIKNNGQIATPFSITVFSDNELGSTTWHEGFIGKKWVRTPSQTSVKSTYYLDYFENTLELYRNDNHFRSTGLLKKTKRLKVQPLGITGNSRRSQINAIPAFGWNYHNKFMLGAGLYSVPVPQPKFEYQIMPLYAFGSNDLVGSVQFNYHILPSDSRFQTIDFRMAGKQYAGEINDSRFKKVNVGMDLKLKNASSKSKVQNTIAIDAVLANRPLVGTESDKHYSIYNLRYSHFNERTFYPYDFDLNIEFGEGFSKAWFQTHFKVIYEYTKSLEVRLFSGIFLHKKDNLSPLFNYRLSGALGEEDYKYSETFLGRYVDYASGNILGHQFVANDGGFASYAPIQSNQWLAAINLTSSLPLPSWLPLRVYANAATFENSIDAPLTIGSFAAEFGIKATVGILELYLPLVMSKELNDLNNIYTDKYVDRIRFSIQFSTVNLYRIVQRGMF